MTNQRRVPAGNNGEFKQLFRRECPATPFTSSTMTLDDYLHTDVWKKLRAARLKIDHRQCQECGTAMNLVVHHIRYPDVWGMENVEDDLITLCDTCHELVHKNDIMHKEDHE